MNDFSRLQRALLAEDYPTELEIPFADEACEMLRRAIVAARLTPQAVGPGDLAGLVRHVLCRAQAVTADAGFFLAVPRKTPWPDDRLWRESGVTVVAADERRARIRIEQSWSVPWLADSDRFDPLRDSFAGVNRRCGWPSLPRLPLDPALEFGLKLDFPGYQGPGQRQAIRAAFFLPPGGTLVANLPTGTGKSLVAWAPALLSPKGSLTIMIVPTTALALDQERQLRERFPEIPLPRELALYSGMPVEAREAVLERLLSGTQPIVICSPETLMGTLSRRTFEAASTGTLKYLVIDEAHMVTQWGNDFRPEFQAIAGMRRALRKSCPAGKAFRTLLLSATLTADCFDVLRRLFAEDEFEAVQAVALRPEPEYWLSPSVDAAERQGKVEALARVLPRPFLLYVTSPNDADLWLKRLRSMGILRSACVHGRTSAPDREAVVDRWRSGEIDVVVATSAFGLGMDKANVRAIVHACIPESVDRFYQEVGRAGRDGRAAVSFLLPCDATDRNLAENLSKECVITLEKGFDRWSAMIEDATREPDGLWRLDLNARTPSVHQDSDANVAWNLLTLILMNRVGMLRLGAKPPPTVERQEGEAESHFEARLQAEIRRHSTSAYVSDLVDEHRDPSMWEKHVAPVRGQMYEAGRTAWKHVEELCQGRIELGQLLAKVYAIKHPEFPAEVEPTCSGCPGCRGRDERPPFSYPQPQPLRQIGHRNAAELKRVLNIQGDLLLVRCDTDGIRDKRVRSLWLLAKLLVERGIDELAIPNAWKCGSDWEQIRLSSPLRFVVGSSLTGPVEIGPEPKLPRATFLLDQSTTVVPHSLVALDRPLHLLFLPANAIEEGPEGRPFFDRNSAVSEAFVRERLCAS